MPNLGSPILTFLLDLVVAIGPYVLLAAGLFFLGMAAWAQRQKGKVTRQQWLQEAAQQAVTAAEQAVAQADKDGKFQFAKALLEAQVGKVGEAQVVTLIENAVARLHLMAAGSIAAQQTSASAKPILAKIAAPTTGQRLGAEGEAILRGIRADLVAVKNDAAEAKARAIAAEQAARTPQTPAARTTKTVSSGKDAPVTFTPAAPAEVPTAAVTPAASSQP